MIASWCIQADVTILDLTSRCLVLLTKLGMLPSTKWTYQAQLCRQACQHKCLAHFLALAGGGGSGYNRGVCGDDGDGYRI